MAKSEILGRVRQWFLENDEEGNKRPQAFDGQMVTCAGVDVAVLFIQWVGKNFPGCDWKRKASQLVRSTPEQAFYKE